jgi:hypothetical protein
VEARIPEKELLLRVGPYYDQSWTHTFRDQVAAPGDEGEEPVLVTLKTCARLSYSVPDGLLVQSPEGFLIAVIRRDQLPGAQLKALLPKRPKNPRTEAFPFYCRGRAHGLAV